MIIRLLICLTAFLPLSLPVEAGIMDVLSRAFSKETAPKPQSIRILLAQDEAGVFLEVKGKYHIFDPHTNTHISTSYVGKRRVVEATHDGIRWGEEFPGVYQIVVIPDSPETTTLVDGIEYRGNMYIYDVEGAISIVNQIDVEDFLSSILPQRYPDLLPEQVLEAIAIAARTDSYFLAQSGKNPYWDVESQKIGYQGNVLTRSSKSLDNAVRETRYLVLHRVGTGDWVKTPFAVSWKPLSGEKSNDVAYSAISIDDAVKLSNKGATAVQIIDKAFPNTSIQKIYEPTS